jgi:hypothetical protein
MSLGIEKERPVNGIHWMVSGKAKKRQRNHGWRKHQNLQKRKDYDQHNNMENTEPVAPSSFPCTTW